MEDMVGVIPGWEELQSVVVQHNKIELTVTEPSVVEEGDTKEAFHE